MTGLQTTQRRGVQGILAFSIPRLPATFVKNLYLSWHEPAWREPVTIDRSALYIYQYPCYQGVSLPGCTRSGNRLVLLCLRQNRLLLFACARRHTMSGLNTFARITEETAPLLLEAGGFDLEVRSSMQISAVYRAWRKACSAKPLKSSNNKVMFSETHAICGLSQNCCFHFPHRCVCKT